MTKMQKENIKSRILSDTPEVFFLSFKSYYLVSVGGRSALKKRSLYRIRILIRVLITRVGFIRFTGRIDRLFNSVYRRRFIVLVR